MPPQLKVLAPAPDATVRTKRVVVRGTVEPSGTPVQVMGEDAEVTGSLFRAEVPMEMGRNSVDVVAVGASGEPATTTVKVTRGRTPAQIEAAVTAEKQRKARAAAKRKARAARAAARRRAREKQAASASGGGGDCVTVPNVVGKDHQLAQDTMQGAGLYMLDEEDATGQGRMLILDRNWTTVSQDPPAGSCVSPDATILLSAKKDGE